MIKIYSMNTCPDCIYVEEQIQGDDRYEIIDIGSHVKHLKEFLRIRDNSPVFNEAKKVGAAGIPCFVLEDGSVTLIPEEAGLASRPITEGVSCNRLCICNRLLLNILQVISQKYGLNL